MIEMEIIHPVYGEITVVVSYHYIPRSAPILEGPADRWYLGEAEQVDITNVKIEGGNHHGEQVDEALIDYEELLVAVERGFVDDEYMEAEYQLE